MGATNQQKPFLFFLIAESYRVNTLAGPIIPVMNDDATKNATKGLFKLTLHQTTEFRTACSDTKTK